MYQNVTAQKRCSSGKGLKAYTKIHQREHKLEIRDGDRGHKLVWMSPTESIDCRHKLQYIVLRTTNKNKKQERKNTKKNTKREHSTSKTTTSRNKKQEQKCVSSGKQELQARTKKLQARTRNKA